jgi:hypothetical protein
VRGELGEVEKCPKCGGEMREGALTIRVAEDTTTTDPFMKAMLTRSGNIGDTLSMLQTEHIIIEGPLWQEPTGKEEGWLIKRREMKVLPLRGKRCLNCGYVELYVKEK